MSILLALSLKIAAVLAATGLVSLFLHRASASQRHLVWTLGLGVALALPALAVFSPTWSVPLSEVFGEEAPAVAAAGSQATPLGSEPTPREVTQLPASARATTEPSEDVSGAPVPAAAPVRPNPAGVSATVGTRRSWTASIPPTAQILVWSWLAVTAVLLCTIGLSLARVARLGARSTPITDPRIRQMARRLSDQLGIRRPVRLVGGDASSMPMIWGATVPVLHLPNTASSWTDDRLRAVLLHELAHVRRYDYATQLMARLACAIHWFNPLMWVAAYRLRVERELACDDVVINAGSKPSSYAAHLLYIARSLRVGAIESVASIAMAKRSQLSGRLLAVLDPGRARYAVSPKGVLRACAVALPIAVLIAGASGAAVADSTDPVTTLGTPATPMASIEFEEPTLESRATTSVPELPARGTHALPQWSQSCDWADSEGRRSSSMSIEDDRIRISLRIGECWLDVKAMGDITFSDDERDIISITRGGFLEIEERNGRDRRGVIIESGANGLDRKWIVNGIEQPFGQDATDWLARMVPMMFRVAGLDAEARAARIYARGGAEAVLQEIEFIASDHVAAKYFAVLLSQDDVDTKTVRRVIRQAGAQISSDYALAALLITVAEKQPLDDTVLAVYVEAANTLGSDHEHGRVLRAVLTRENISRGLADAMLKSARQIESDYEVSRLLLAVIDRHPIDDALTPAFIAVVESIGSDHERGRVLEAALKAGAPSLPVLDRILESARGIESDHTLSTLLMRVGELYPLDRQLPRSFVAAAKTLDSDHNLSQVLSTLLERDALGEDALLQVLDVTAEMESDHSMSQVLMLVADRYALNGRVGQKYLRAVSRSGSDFERGRLLTAAIDRASISTEMLSGVLEVAASIESEHTLATLLIKVAQRHGVSDDIRASFMRATDALGSTHQRGRVLDAAFPRNGN